MQVWCGVVGVVLIQVPGGENIAQHLICDNQDVRDNDDKYDDNDNDDADDADDDNDDDANV